MSEAPKINAAAEKNAKRSGELMDLFRKAGGYNEAVPLKTVKRKIKGLHARMKLKKHK